MITIQPNYGWCSDDKGVIRLRRLIERLSRLLDQLYSGCPDPLWLRPTDRFNGWVFVEKRNSNPHVHLLISCPSGIDQVFRSLFLLEVLDNVVKQRQRAQDDRWQRETRAFINHRPWSAKQRWRPTDSVLKPLAPGATAMVQVLRTQEDVREVSHYITKEWRLSTEQLAARSRVPLMDWAMDYYELQEFFPTQRRPPARRWCRAPDGSQLLDLDRPVWRNHRGIIK